MRKIILVALAATLTAPPAIAAGPADSQAMPGAQAGSSGQSAGQEDGNRLLDAINSIGRQTAIIDSRLALAPEDVRVVPTERVVDRDSSQVLQRAIDAHDSQIAELDTYVRSKPALAQALQAAGASADRVVAMDAREDAVVLYVQGQGQTAATPESARAAPKPGESRTDGSPPSVLPKAQ